MTMRSVKVGDFDYYYVSDFRIAVPELKRKFRADKPLAKTAEFSDYCIHVRMCNSVWTASEKYSSQLDKWVIRKDFVDKYLGNTTTIASTQSVTQDVSELTLDDYPIIELEDHEKFRAADGSIVNVEVRGTRHRDRIIFRALDIANMLDIESTFERNIRAKKITMVEGEDFVLWYNVPGSTRDVIYLTFLGLLRTIFNSRKPNARHYMNWAMDLLFVAQFGSQEQRIDLAKKIMRYGPSIRDIIKVTDCCDGRKKSNGKTDRSSVGFCGLYCIVLRTVKDVRTIMDIPESVPDHHLVVKYGLSRDMSQRLSAYPSKFKELGVTLDSTETITIQYVDSECIAAAEETIKEMIDEFDWGLKYKDNTELFTLDPKLVNQVKERFYFAAAKYANDATVTLNGMLKDKEAEIRELKLKHDNELLRMQNLLDKTDAECKTKEQINENLKIKLELEQLKNKLSSLNITYCNE